LVAINRRDRDRPIGQTERLSRHEISRARDHPAVPTCAQWAAFPNLSVQRNSRASDGEGKSAAVAA
jgi:hypothetical protein